MKKIIYFFTIISIFACAKEAIVDPPNITPKTPSVNLSKIEVGQQSQYIKYITSCNNFLGDFKFTGDTLTLTIIEEGGKTFAQEHLSGDFVGLTDTVKYELYNEANELVINDRFASSLFFFYANDRIELNPTDFSELKQQDCKIHLGDTVFEGNDIGKLEEFNLASIQLQDLTVVSCEPIEDLEAYLMYNPTSLSASHQIFLDFENPSNSQIVGYLLID